MAAEAGDPGREWTQISVQFREELYETIKTQKATIAALTKELDAVTHDKEELEDQIGTVLAHYAPERFNIRRHA